MTPGSTPRPPEVERRGLTVHVDGAPALHLAGPLLTRPEDWAPTARALLWPELARGARLEARR